MRQADKKTRLTPEEAFVQKVLRKMGLAVERVAESHRDGERTCDFKAIDGDATFWVEVKTRTEDATISEKLQREKVVLQSHPLGYCPSMASIISHAVTQLDAQARREEGFEVLWMVLSHPGECDRHWTQAIATAFGSEEIIDFVGESRDCYSFKESSFFKHKSLDAMAVYAANRRMTLCVNPESPRAAAFRDTTLFRFFEEGGRKQGAFGVIDPEGMEKAGLAYIADCDIPRRDAEAVMAYVRKKYGLPPHSTHITLDLHTATTLLPPSEK
jgi:hypothetical protein